MKRNGLIALAMVAALIVAVVGAAQLAGGSSGSAPETGLTVNLTDGQGSAAVPSTGLEVRTSADSGELAPSSFGLEEYGDETAPPLPELAGRKILRNATVSLGVEDVGAAVQQVESIAGSAGGFVSASSVFVEEPPQPLDGDSEPPRKTQSATVTIRVPATAYASVMNRLRGISGELDGESSTTEDVSEEFADLEARLRNLEATEARYLELLQTAKTIPDILSLQDRLNAVRLEIERIQGRINLLNDLADLASITVQLRPLAAVETPQETDWAQQAWEDAWQTSEDALQALGTAAIVVGVVLAWLAVPALAIAIGWRLFGPRRPRGGEAGGTGASA
jgi:hypothetical protein